MADPFPKTITLTIKCEMSDDLTLTCFLCGRDQCEYEFSYRARGQRVTSGAHRDCAQFAEMDKV